MSDRRKPFCRVFGRSGPHRGPKKDRFGQNGLNLPPHPTRRKRCFDEMNQIETTLSIFGGRCVCQRCTAKSKRTGLQCGAVAMRGKTKCAQHGGKSTGPKTAEGKTRAATAPLKHGMTTAAAKVHRRDILKDLQEMEDLAREAGVIVGPRSPGRRMG